MRRALGDLPHVCGVWMDGPCQRARPSARPVYAGGRFQTLFVGWQPGSEFLTSILVAGMDAVAKAWGRVFFVPIAGFDPRQTRRRGPCCGSVAARHLATGGLIRHRRTV